jgi:elongation factor Ts
VKLAGFARFQLGEGIDRPEGPDFASEVAAAAGAPPQPPPAPPGG